MRGFDANAADTGSEADTSASLKKIPETFNALLESRGVFEAVRIMVKLLFVE